MQESTILKRCMLEATRLGRRLFRNQTGQYILADGRVIRSGLAVGSGDLIGWTPVLITPDMVGQTVAVFTSVECKAAKGKLSDAQAAWIRTVQEAGGMAGVARDAEDVAKISTFEL